MGPDLRACAAAVVGQPTPRDNRSSPSQIYMQKLRATAGGICPAGSILLGPQATWARESIMINLCSDSVIL